MGLATVLSDRLFHHCNGMEETGRQWSYVANVQRQRWLGGMPRKSRQRLKHQGNAFPTLIGRNVKRRLKLNPSIFCLPLLKLGSSSLQDREGKIPAEGIIVLNVLSMCQHVFFGECFHLF